MKIGKSCKAALAATCLLAAAAIPGVAHALGTPTYRFYVGGGMGGQVETTGGVPPWPQGACGLRALSDNVLAWYWAKGEYGITGELDIPNNGWMPDSGQLMELIEFSGPYGEGCEGPYVFHTPATPDSLVPPGAIALVVQVYDADRVEYLDADLHPYEPPEEEWGEVPEEPDPCEVVPTICEPPGSGVDDPCDSPTWSGLCDIAISGISPVTHGSGELLRPILTWLGRPPADVPTLRRALDRTRQAQRSLAALDMQRDRLLGSAGDRLRTAPSRRALESISTGVDLARIHSRQCQRGIEEALRVSGMPSRRAGAAAAQDRAVRSCAAAIDALAETQREALRLSALYLRNEAP